MSRLVELLRRRHTGRPGAPATHSNKHQTTVLRELCGTRRVLSVTRFALLVAAVAVAVFVAALVASR